LHVTTLPHHTTPQLILYFLQPDLGVFAWLFLDREIMKMNAPFALKVWEIPTLKLGITSQTT
jgi:hypothetical protein